MRNWFIFEKKHHPQNLSRIFTMSFDMFYNFAKAMVFNLFKGKIKSAIFFFFSVFRGIPIYLNLSIQNYYSK